MNFTKFPRRNYLQGPTPIEFLPSLSKALGGAVNLYVKRDDLLPGSGGGNKTRKLEFCIADALDQGADAIITCGAVQSNHARLTAAWSAKEGLDCHLILEERVKGSYKAEASGNNFLFELLDVKSIGVVSGGSDMMAEMAPRTITRPMRNKIGLPAFAMTAATEPPTRAARNFTTAPTKSPAVKERPALTINQPARPCSLIVC